MSGGFVLQVEILIDQIAIVVESHGPFQEIAAVAHQAGFESGEELTCRQAVLLLKSVKFGNNRIETFLHIKWLALRVTKRREL